MAGRIGRRIYNLRKWTICRQRALFRDGHRCTKCGKSGRLEVHHIQPLVDGGEPFDLINLESLCVPCHLGAHAMDVDAERAAWRNRMINGS